MPGFLLQLCAVHRSSSFFFDEYRHLTQAHHRALAARPVVAAARLRRRRALCAPATHLQKRRQVLGCRSLNKIFDRRLTMASHQEIRRRCSVADRVPADLIMPIAAANSNSDTSSPSTTTTSPVATPVRDLAQGKQPEPTHSRQNSTASTASMPPPPMSRDDAPNFRRGHSRSKSSMCRQVNRLSLTLPIAPPTSDPSRPTPTSAMSSVPPTPIDSAVTSPSDANEFIIAIAAQERRVLELREELTRAESNLTLLKKKWTTQDGPRKRGDPFPLESTRPVASTTDDDLSASRRSVDMDRRKLLQQSQPSTPQQGRRKVLRGGHTRTLSLLSPAKDTEFSLHEDLQAPVKLPTIERRAAQLTNPNLSKRASWAPRSQQNVAGVGQVVEDFKLGLKAFVEDIRQITVGDEPISGQQFRTTAIDYRNGAPGNQDTIRPSHPLRPKVSTVFEPPHSAESSPARGTKVAPQEKPKAKSKHFSWTPLGLDSLDDNDWSNWESPASTKTSRWSGSTMGSSGLDDTPDEEEQNTTPLKKRSTGFDSPLLSPKLEEISNMVNRLTPSNIKRTATNLMDEWEKSLMDPQNQRQAPVRVQNKENSV